LMRCKETDSSCGSVSLLRGIASKMCSRNWIQRLPGKLLVVCALALLAGLSSCASDKDMAYLNDQVIALNRRVAKLEEGMDTKLSTLRTSQGDARVELDQIRGEMEKFSGRLEDNERVLKKTVERDLGDQDVAKRGVTELSQRVSDLERMVRSQQEFLGMEAPAQRESREQGRPAVEPAQPVQPPAAPAAPPEASKPKDADLYDGSIASFRAGKVEDALLGFKDFIKRYPKSDRAENAQFWVGECYMALKQYEQAILAFQEVIKKYPKGAKVPSALLRQSVAFQEINDKTSSKLLLRKIVKEYPKSSEAKIAAKKLETAK
jgi:tol-pal system protein YbgF